MSTAVLVMAKAPVAGFAKTRLCPPATARQSARIAAAALLDTLDTLDMFGALNARRGQAGAVVVAIAGRLADAEYAGALRAALARTAVLGQRGESLAERIVNAHAATARRYPGSAVLQIGSDTPQLPHALLDGAARALRQSTVDAVLGPATDGGWWALGLRDPLAAAAIRDVPTSRPDTGERTLAALRRHGLRVALLPELSDVDTWADAERVAGDCPASRFAAAVRSVRLTAAG